MNWLEGLLEKIRAKFFESGSGEGLGEVNTVHDTFNGDGDLMDTGKISLRFLNFILKLLESSWVFFEINSVILFLENFDEMLSNSLIKIFTTKMGISSSSDNLEYTVINSEEGNIESSTTKIEDDNVLLS